MGLIRHIALVITLLSILSAKSTGQSSDLGTVCAESRHLYGVTGLPGSTFIWALSGGIIVQGGGTDSLLVEWGYATGNFQMEVVELSASGCLGLPVMGDVVVQAPEVDLGYDFYEICEGEFFTFDASGSYNGVPVYLWHDGSINSFYTADTTENIWVLVTDGLGCTRYDSVDFVANPIPVVNLGSDTIFCNAEEPLEIDAGDFITYNWTTNTDNFVNNPIYIYQQNEFTDTVRVTVTNEFGCAGYDTMLVYPCSLARIFDGMINTFTPNGDGDNDTWVILTDQRMDQFPNAVLEVFDRWGRLVYRSKNVAGEPWDGTSKGRPMPMDAYFYVLELNYAGFEAVTGTVNLIR